MNVEPGEFVSARDASRSLGKLFDRLEAGEIAKAVIVDRNRPRAVVLSVVAYESSNGGGVTPAILKATLKLYTKLAQTHPGSKADEEGWLDEWNELRDALAAYNRTQGRL
jgi:hypothetical protein